MEFKPNILDESSNMVWLQFYKMPQEVLYLHFNSKLLFILHFWHRTVTVIILVVISSTNNLIFATRHDYYSHFIDEETEV